MKKNLIVTLTLLLCSFAIFSAPYNGQNFDFEQPDGSIVTVKLFGDEYYMKVESPDGYTLIRDDSTGWICYAKLSDDKEKLLSTGIRYTGATLKSTHQIQGVVKHLDIKESARTSIANSNAKLLNEDMAREYRAGKSNLKTNSLPITGKIKGLTIMIDFSDAPGTVTRNTIIDFCNKSGFTGFGNNGSVKDYFYDISGGVVEYENQVFGYYRAPKSFATYDAMSYATGAQQILYAALNWIDQQGFDFSTLTIKDGRIRAINLMYTGNPATWAKGMWYHRGWYYGFSADGVSTGNYNTSPINNNMGIGVICHENGHMLGDWPDTYKYYSNTGVDGIGAFDLMCSYGSSKNPVPPNPHFRHLAGWGTAINLNNTNKTYTENANSINSYKYTNPSNSKEFFLIEPRQKTGRSYQLPDQGLTIWHIDTNGDNQTTNHEVFLEHANNNINYHNGACWHEGGSTTFNDNTSPNARWKNGAHSGLEISNISAAGSSMSFTIGTEDTGGGDDGDDDEGGDDEVTTTGNLAQGKPINASSTWSDSYLASYAVDGNSSTRWASASNKYVKWITVDLEQDYDIDEIVIKWETAYGRDYTIQVWDGSTWQVIKTVTNNTQLTNKLTDINTKARYISLNCTEALYNHISIFEIEVYEKVNEINIALNKGIESSNDWSTTYAKEFANDGSLNSRWASASNEDNKWIYVDLQNTYNVNKVVVNWESAYGTDYGIYYYDGSNWQLIKEVTGNNVLTNTLTDLNTNARYVLLYCTAAPYNHISVWEFEIYGTLASAPKQAAPAKIITPDAIPDAPIDLIEKADISVYPNPASNTVKIKCNDLDGAKIEILNIMGKVVKSSIANNNSEEIDISNLSSGVYIVNIKKGILNLLQEKIIIK